MDRQQNIRMYGFPEWTMAQSIQIREFCIYKPLNNAIHSHTPGILGMGLGSVHCPDQYLIQLASNLTQMLWGRS